MTLHFGAMRAPDSLLFGTGQRRSIGLAATSLGKSALVCTDRRFAATSEMAEMVSILERTGIAVQVFADTEAELPIDGIETCAVQFRDLSPDMVIGIGGGSCLDLAKLVSLLLTHGGDLSRYYGEQKVPGPIRPVIAVPTTAGTGSEVTPVAVLGDRRRELKVGISSPYLIPAIAICDPELTVTAPPSLSAIAGADAMTHAIEAVSAVRHPVTPELGFRRVFVGKNEISDYNALHAIHLISRSLPIVVGNGSDLQARSDLMLGSTVAGLAFGVAGTAAAHAIQYPVGALTKTAHGLGVAALMPYVMEFNRPACCESFAAIARAMGAEGRDETALADHAVAMVRDLFRTIGIPLTLAELGVTKDKIEWIAEKTLLSTRLVQNNPVPLTRKAALEITHRAFRGH